MKKLIICFLLSGCSSVDLYPVRHFINLSGKDLAKESEQNLKASALDSYVPTKSERNKYYSQLENSITYRNYLILECTQLLIKEQNLQLDKPVYASNPEWNNVQNWYVSVFNFYSLVNNISREKTMDCDLAINDKKEVTEYQIKESHFKINKN